jgi:hypothetical protein
MLTTAAPFEISCGYFPDATIVLDEYQHEKME